MTRAPALLLTVLEQRKEDIIRRFVGAVQYQDLPPEGTPRWHLVNHLPLFLDELIGELHQHRAVRESQDAFDTSPTARRHGGQRWNLGYDLEALVREYGVFRHCILETLKDAGVGLSTDEFDTLAKCLNVGVAEAAAAYAAHRDEQLFAQRKRLEFLVEAGQALTSSLDIQRTLAELTRLIVPKLADCALIQVQGQPIEQLPMAHVEPGKLPLLRELLRDFSTVRQPPFDALIESPTQSRLVSRVEDGSLLSFAQNDEHLALLRAISVQSWMSVPLRLRDGSRGVIVFAQCSSERHFDEGDLLLAEELARRTETAMDNARLYAVSQAERAAVEEATRAKDEFVAMISHELRTPLNAVLGWTRMLRTHVLPEGRREHALKVIERNTLAQNQLIDDLLDISRIITGNMRIAPTELDLAAVVEAAIENARSLADAKQIRIDVAIESGSSRINADAGRLRQVVANLLTNAFKFTPKAGNVRVSLQQTSGHLELRIQDTGAGISAEFLPHVFEHFRQSHAGTTRAAGGLGIGLTIVKHLVELHGGSVEAQSPGVGQGATFVVRLPLTGGGAAALPVGPVGSNEEASVRASKGLENLRVLVIDDDPDTRELLATVLETSEMAVTTARSAAEALQQLAKVQPDLIISDIGLPDDDGYSLIRTIRGLESSASRDIPSLALTAYARGEDRDRALAAGFTAYATKPIEPAALLAILGKLAERRAEALE